MYLECLCTFHHDGDNGSLSFAYLIITSFKTAVFPLIHHTEGHKRHVEAGVY